MNPAIWISSAFIALTVAALPGGATAPDWRGAPIILSFLLLGWSHSQIAILSSFVLGWLLETLGHLPAGSLVIPGVLLTVITSILRPRIQRYQMALQVLFVGILVFLFEAGMNAWQSIHSLPVADAGWLSPVLAVALWAPLSMAITPPDTAL